MKELLSEFNELSLGKKAAIAGAAVGGFALVGGAVALSLLKTGVFLSWLTGMSVKQGVACAAGLGVAGIAVHPEMGGPHLKKLVFGKSK